MTKNSYSIIYADPPWAFRNKNTGGSMLSGAAAKYPVLDIKSICALDVDSICHEDCVLFMWWVGSQPWAAIKVCEA